MRIIVVLLFVLGSLNTQAQDLTGIWRGNFISADNRLMDLFNAEDRYKYEVQLDQRGKAFNGVTYSYKTTVFYGKASASGTFNPATGLVRLEELKLLELKMAPESYACWMVCYLKYTKNGEEEFLEGKYSSYKQTDSSFCGRGTVFLRKVVTSDFYREPFLVKKGKDKAAISPVPKVPDSLKTTSAGKLPGNSKKPAPKLVAKVPANPLVKKPATPLPGQNKNLAKNNPPAPPPRPIILHADPKDAPLVGNQSPEHKSPAIRKMETTITPPVLKNRENELVQTIVVNTGEINIDIYDNGTIDHDTISVYLDKKLVISHEMLKETPITMKISMDEDNNYHELVMVAENLGDIPPNTSLMVVKAGEKQYEVRITSTEQKNAVVIFKYIKPK